LGVAAIVRGRQSHLEVGNLNAKRDWGYAPEYVDLMWRMLQEDEPEDYVAATGKTQTVRYCIEKAFEVVGIGLEWFGEGVDEVGKDIRTGKLLVKVNPVFFRPAEVDLLLGDCSKAKARLGWSPSLTFEELIGRMVTSDLELSPK
jgi:GDPmannose 4,6-dehydratase